MRRDLEARAGAVARESERVLGVDPGTSATGWGVIEARPLGPARVASGVVRARGELAARLAAISAAIGEIIRIHSPGVLSLEKTFVGQNIQSAFRLGEARGAVLVAAATAGLCVREYSPAEVKLAVAGYGRAGKAQVQGMVARLLGLETLPAADEADALAVALCHFHSREMARRLTAAVGEIRTPRRFRFEAAR